MRDSCTHRYNPFCFHISILRGTSGIVTPPCTLSMYMSGQPVCENNRKRTNRTRSKTEITWDFQRGSGCRQNARGGSGCEARVLWLTVIKTSRLPHVDWVHSGHLLLTCPSSPSILAGVGFGSLATAISLKAEDMTVYVQCLLSI